MGQRKNDDAGLRYRSGLAVKLAPAKAEEGIISQADINRRDANHSQGASRDAEFRYVRG